MTRLLTAEFDRRTDATPFHLTTALFVQNLRLFFFCPVIWSGEEAAGSRAARLVSLPGPMRRVGERQAASWIGVGREAHGMSRVAVVFRVMAN